MTDKTSPSTFSVAHTTGFCSGVIAVGWCIIAILLVIHHG